ncbi:hypothetical protein GJ496_006119 [Pomphorhynchus laevis]|nr:hypothetical protein GJ496_006119 [Pomphorhynchus laevis]
MLILFSRLIVKCALLDAVMGFLVSKFKNNANIRITKEDEVIFRLKQQRDKLRQYQNQLDLQKQSEYVRISSLLAKNERSRALQILKRIKIIEQICTKVENQLTVLDQMSHDIEDSQIQIEVLNALNNGNECLKRLNELLTIEDIEQCLADVHEQVDLQNEFTSAISGGTKSIDQYDDKQLELDLNELIASNKISEKLETLPDPSSLLPICDADTKSKFEQKYKVYEVAQ